MNTSLYARGGGRLPDRDMGVQQPLQAGFTSTRRTACPSVHRSPLPARQHPAVRRAPQSGDAGLHRAPAVQWEGRLWQSRSSRRAGSRAFGKARALGKTFSSMQNALCLGKFSNQCGGRSPAAVRIKCTGKPESCRVDGWICNAWGSEFLCNVTIHLDEVAGLIFWRPHLKALRDLCLLTGSEGVAHVNLRFVGC